MTREEVAAICLKHGMQQKQDEDGVFWVHPKYAGGLIIFLDGTGTWQDYTAHQQDQCEADWSKQFDNRSRDDLDDYLVNFIKLVKVARNP
jgi:hypothetical protein